MLLPYKRTCIPFVFKLCLMVQLLAVKAYAADTLSSARWHQLTAGKAFTYANDTEAAIPPKPVEMSGLEKFIYILISFFGGGVGRAILWLIVIAIVVFIVYKLLLSTDSIIFGRSGKRLKAADEVPADAGEDIAATDWEALYLAAAAGAHHRLAVRYSYMWLLQLLQRRELIRFSTDKTNFDYYGELASSAYAQPFRQLSRRYEYVWYGQFALSPAAYDSYIDSFNNIRKQLGA